MTHRKLPIIKIQQYHLLIEALYYEAAAVNKIALDSTDSSAREAFEAKRQALNDLAQFIIDGSTAITDTESERELELAILKILDGKHANKIRAIKEYRAITGASLKVAKDTVEAIMERAGIWGRGISYP